MRGPFAGGGACERTCTAIECAGSSGRDGKTSRRPGTAPERKERVVTGDLVQVPLHTVVVPAKLGQVVDKEHGRTFVHGNVQAVHELELVEVLPFDLDFLVLPAEPRRQGQVDQLEAADNDAAPERKHPERPGNGIVELESGEDFQGRGSAHHCRHCVCGGVDVHG